MNPLSNLVEQLEEAKFRLQYVQKLDDKTISDIDELKKLPYEIAKLEHKIDKIAIPEGCNTQLMTYEQVQRFIEIQEKHIKTLDGKEFEITTLLQEVTSVLEHRNNSLKVADISLKELKDLLTAACVSNKRIPLLLM